ncbi:MAG: DNA polymerase III subunit delta [Acidobacteria bacterium]|nr:DNA polymerase III subunit delta [Acidobacteriota bacterium]
MTPVTYHSIQALRVSRELQEQVLPVYLLLGPDLYLRERAIDAFIHCVDPDLRQFNVARFENTQVDLCLDTARTLPMMSTRRVVMLEEISALTDEGWEALYAYLENPSSRTTLLLMADKLHESRVKRIGSSATVISASEPSLSEARLIVEKSFRKEGYRLDPGVVEELLDQTGTQMLSVSQEVEKLKLCKLQEKTISLHDVASLSNRVRTIDIWELVNQMARRNRKKLLLSLHRMLEGGAVPLVLLKSIYSHFAALLVVKELSGRSEAAISKLAGMNPYRVRRLAAQSGQFGIGELKFALRQLHRTDSTLKGTGASEKQLLEMLLVRIIAQRSGGAEGSRLRGTSK